jgi:hypothetical protein
VKIIQLNDLEKEEDNLKEIKVLTQKQRQRLREITAEKIPLTTFLDEAKLQRQRIKEEIGLFPVIIILLFIIFFTSR